MYEEYRKAYWHHREIYGADTAIFYLVGKFYELYDSAANSQTPIRRITELLDIQLSVRKGDHPGGGDGLFAGVPEQSLHKYAARLTGKGWTVVVYDQIKDGRGNVAERAVVRVLTPGSHIEAVSNSADSCSLAGLWLVPPAWGSTDPPSFGIAAVDLTTAAITTFESAAVGKRDSWTADDAFHFFQIHAPREVVVFWKGQAVDQPTEEVLRRQFGLLSAKLRIILADTRGGLEKPEIREDFLRRTIAARALLPIRESLGITTCPLAERALCAILQFIQEIYPSAPKRLRIPEVWSPTSSLYLGNHALIQLNMITPRLEDSVLGLFSKTKTSMGLRAMRRRLLHPIADVRRLNQYYNELDVLQSVPADDIERLLEQIADLPRLHRRITTAQVSATDVLYLDQSYTCAERLAKLLVGTPLAAPAELDFAKLCTSFAAVFSVEKAKVAGDNSSFLQTAAAPDVSLHETAIRDMYTASTRAVDEIAIWSGIQPGVLRLEFRETMGPIVQGPKALLKGVIERLRTTTSPPYPGIKIQDKKTSAGLEIPHLDSLYRDILAARIDLATAVRSVLPPLCDTLSSQLADSWNKLEEWISKVDVSLTLWATSQDLGFVRPLLVPGASASVSIEGLRHPLIEATTNRSEYVRHSVCLDANVNGWLVYGMNASGKSSLMKAVGITVLLAQAGCYVPASRMTLTPFQGLYTRILNTDNLWAGLSSFAVEMTELREILARADQNSLVLGDELCSGTESQSATALVGAGIRWLHERAARFIFATHLHGLMDIPSVVKLSKLRVWHLKVHYDIAADRLLYDRTLTPGPGSTLYGLEVARAMNIPDEILTVAHEIRRELMGTATETDAPLSSWNSIVQRRVCEVCGADIVRDLEVHHIQPRASANTSGRLSDGTHQNHPRNLIVVCQTCHDRHHSGESTIGPRTATSDGPISLSVASSGSVRPRSKWSAEQLELIQNYLRNYPSLPPKRIVFDLEEKERIRISVASLRAIRASMPS